MIRDVPAVPPELTPLLEALLPLAFEDDWHPVQSLAAAPDLPEDWWVQLQPHLEASGKRPSPAVFAALREAWQVRWPRRYRAAGLTRGQTLLADGQVLRGVTVLLEIGEVESARRGVEQWMNERIRAGESRQLLEVMTTLPAAAVDVRVRAAAASVRIAGEDQADAALVRAELNAAYLAGERDARFLYCLAHACQFDAEYERALALLDEALNRPDPHGDLVQLLQLKGAVLGYLGRLQDQTATARQLIQAARTAGDVYFEAMGAVTLGYALEDLGDFAAAEREYRHAARLMRQLNQGPQLATLLNNWAQSLAAAHRPHEALQRLDQALSLPGLQVRHHGWVGASRAMVLHQLGRRAEALPAAQRAAALLREAHLPGDEVWVRCLEAQEAALAGDLPAARAALQVAADLTVPGGRDEALLTFSQVVVAHCAGDTSGVQALLGGLDDAALFPWDAARAQLYRLDLARATGGMLDDTELDAALTAAGGDGPLRTDSPALRDTLGWLAAQPGWSTRIGALTGTEPTPVGIPLHLDLLGPLVLTGPAGDLRFRLWRSLELLAVLILHGPQTRAQLLAHLWDGEVDARTLDLFKKTLRSARDALGPLLPEGADPVVSSGGRYALSEQFTLTLSWRPPGFPAPGVRQTGPVTVRGAFADGARGPWADEVRLDAHEALLRDLEARHTSGDHSVGAALETARYL
ncbi:hypothetical protein IHN63_06600 [Deinococcus sp. 6YEL10]|uniref:tetratricopeptide repeat protein n=1 Tax=Deinococcus sp. 6YEL10 TaxID=2745870 RepID=UPI001E3D156E|nr:tetratricopeptide repeat protein [Deinococcus sp. 6YEL10]MCD0160979.1 hypothetical protein [Deinococcus sp. 6YEL10]